MIERVWATMPGRAVVDAYTHEFTAHSWDLAHVTGRGADLDPDLAARALEAFSAFLPAESRSERGRFGPVVPVPDDADASTRLAAYLGRRPWPGARTATSQSDASPGSPDSPSAGAVSRRSTP